MGRLSTRARVLLAAAVAALPLLTLVAYAAINRYDADRERAVTGAANRALLFSTLLAADPKQKQPTGAQLKYLLELSPLAPETALVVLDGQGRAIARAGPAKAGPGAAGRAALAQRQRTFDETGADGVQRVWGLNPLGKGPSTVAFGLPGYSVYGPAQTALRRDLSLAALAAILAFVVGFVLTSRATAPLRRLAVRVAGDGRGTDEIGVLERGFQQLDEAAEESAAELARRAERLAALRSIDRAILSADTPQDIAQAALGRLRSLVGANRVEVVLFDHDYETAATLAIATVNGTPTSAAGVSVLDGDLLDLRLLQAGRPCVCEDLDALPVLSELGQLLRNAGVRSHAAVPLAAEGQLLGAVKVGFAEPDAVHEDALTAAGEVADQLAIALRHAQLHEELQAVIDEALDGIVIVDDDRRFMAANEPAGRLLGRRHDELIGLCIEDVIACTPGEDLTFERVLTEGSAQGMISGVLVSGERRELEVRARANFRPGRHLFVMRDLTQHLRLEDQLRQAQKMEAVGQLAGGVAHDFNNLLTAISGYGAMARDRIGAGPGGEELEEIERASDRATQLTRQLLAFSRQQVLDPVPLDLNQVVRELVPMLRRLIGEDIEIATLTEADLPAVLADRGQLEQVIINLAVNGRDAMPTGGTLTVETRTVDLDPDYARDHLGAEPGLNVCLIISDTGTGMDPETARHVFEPFYTTKEVGHGTGLGLATVHGIVTQSGGTITVYSEVGLGTSFKIYLPPTETAPATAPAPTNTDNAEQLRGGETILVCEDEPVVRRMVEHILTTNGYTALIADRPSEALRLAAEHPGPIDALLSDVVMPEMPGPQLAERVHALRPGLPTIFTSGYTTQTVRERGNLPAGSAFLEKPFRPMTLLQALRTLIDHAGATPPGQVKQQ